jgi:non-homologous end joining protein Ku
MKTFNEMSLRAIRTDLEKVGVEMSDAQFVSLTHSELKKIYKKSQKAYKLYKQVDAIIDKKKAPTPAVPMAEKTADGKNKIIKGA